METNAVKHTDVRGKEQLYIKIQEGDKQVIINVGQKTYDAVLALMKMQHEKINPHGTKKEQQVITK